MKKEKSDKSSAIVKEKSWIREKWDFTWKHKLTILTYLASIYLIFYTVYTFNEKVNDNLFEYDNWMRYLSQLSILIFTSGMFAAALKYLQLLEVFKDQFNEYIDSSKFDNKLKDNLKLITFSDEYLLQQGNLPTLWKQITLCMYKKEFPLLYDKISKKLRNEFFVKSNISYYYKNFQISYFVEKNCDKSVKITERSSYTIVRPTTEEFSFDFTYRALENDDFVKDVQFIVNVITTGHSFKADIKNAKKDDGHYEFKIENKLFGHLEYHIERIVTTYQNIELDRIRTFGSDRIIDDLSFTIDSDDKVKVTAHFLGKNKFYHNGAFEDGVEAYINRDVFLPGQKFFLVFTLN